MFWVRLKRALLTLAVVLAVFGAYLLIAVPWIEPEVRRAPPIPPPGLHDDRYAERLASLFPPGAWQLQQPKVLENDRAMLLLKDYRPLDDGRLELKPCTVIINPPPPPGTAAPTDGSSQRTLVFDAPQGAVLQFDGGMDLARAEIGRLLGGMLTGPVRLTARESRPGAGDRIEFTTFNVQIDSQRIWTPHEVQFRMGESFGSGRDLIVKLLPPKGTVHPVRNEFRVGGVDSIELVHVDKVRILTEAGGMFGRAQRSANAATAARPSLPVEVTCRGPFRFDLVQYVATLEDQVDVIRVHPDGPSDQLNCHLLAMYFAPPGRDAAAAEPNAPSQPPAERRRALPRLKMRKIVAVGSPVTVRSSATGIAVRGQRLQYDLQTERLDLQGDQGVLLRHGTQQIEAMQLAYQPDALGGLGEVHALGPGRLSGTMSSDGRQPFLATWQRQLQLQPHQERHVATLAGDAHARVEGLGGISGDEIHLWLRPAPPTVQPAAPTNRAGGDPIRGRVGLPSNVRVEPERLVATGRVRVDSPRLSVETAKLDVILPVPDAAASQPPLQPTTDPDGQDSLASLLPAAPNGASQKFHLVGNTVQVALAKHNGADAVQSVVVDGQAAIRQSAANQPDALSLSGHRIRLEQLTAGGGQMHLVGAPARVAARGMEMVGQTMHLDRTAGRLTIDGAGQVTVPTTQDWQGRPLAAGAQRATITWQRRMTFDGRTVHFEGGVVGHTDQQRMQTESLDATLDRPIDMANPRTDGKVDIARLVAPQQVALVSATIERDVQQSLDKMLLANVTIDRQTGQVLSQGPGWISTVRHGQALQSAGATDATPTADDGDQGLFYLHVEFQQGIEGNLQRKVVNLIDRVVTTYGPVDDWQQTVSADAPGGLGQHGVTMRCDRMVLTDMGPSGELKHTIEMLALGNTVVEGKLFTARAHRLSYAQAKDLLVLEGDGRSDAQLWRQSHVGGPSSHAAARKIMFWRSAGQVKVSDAQFLDLTQLPAARQ